MVDPETGRRSLYVNKLYTRSIVGLYVSQFWSNRPDLRVKSCTVWVVRRRKEESQMLLAYLFAQTDVPEIQVILPTAPAVSNEGPRSRVLVPLPAVSWPCRCSVRAT